MIQKMTNHSHQQMLANNTPNKSIWEHSEKSNLMKNKSNKAVKNQSKLLSLKLNQPLVQEPKVYWEIEIQLFMLIQKDQ